MSTRYSQIDRDLIEIRNSEAATMWDGYRFGRPGDFQEFYDDFHRFVVAEWTKTVVGTGTVIAGQLRCGQLSLTTSNASGDNVNIQWQQSSGASNQFIYPLQGKEIYFETSFSFQGDATADVAILGICGSGTTDPIGSPPNDGIYFVKHGASTSIDFVTSMGGVESVDVGIASVTADVFTKLGFKITGSDLVEYYVNGIKKGQFHTNIPHSTVANAFSFFGLSPTFEIQTSANVIKRMFIDYVFVAQER